MNVIITGVGPHNKGAELMLLAILDQLKQRLPEARPIVPPTCGPYAWRARHGLFQLLDSTRSGRLGWLRKRLLHQGYRNRFGLVLPEQVDVVLDASGYAFGDAWGPEAVEGAARQFERYKRLGSRIILLPQAFGPFENPRVRAASARILDSADMVFARDSESLAHCRAVAPEHPMLSRTPDFTSLLDGHLPRDWVTDDRHVALVPNLKMKTHTDLETARNYVPAMAQVIQEVTKAGYHPFVLLHEQQDADLAREITDQTGGGCRIIEEPDPLAIKAILGACAFTVGSRFHGLVSALSQGVPSIGTGWSHKYLQLFQDYDFGEGLWSIEGRLQSLIPALSTILDEDARTDISGRLKLRREGLEASVKQAWQDIFDCLARKQ